MKRGEGVGGIQISANQHDEGVCSNVISVTRGGSFKFPERLVK